MYLFRVLLIRLLSSVCFSQVWHRKVHIFLDLVLLIRYHCLYLVTTRTRHSPIFFPSVTPLKTSTYNRNIYLKNCTIVLRCKRTEFGNEEKNKQRKGGRKKKMKRRKEGLQLIGCMVFLKFSSKVLLTRLLTDLFWFG